MSFRLPAVTAERMRALDREARVRFGIPELILMEHAGSGAVREIRRLLRRDRRRTGAVLVLAGPGANGGDGFVVARQMDNGGVPVEVLLLGDPARLRGAAKINWEILGRIGVTRRTIRGKSDWERWLRKKPRIRLVLDAILGTGLSGPVREPIRQVIGWLNRLPCEVVAMDLPSGLCADTGRPLGAAVRATRTVACAFPKAGFAGARRYTGRVVVADISFPRVLRP